MSVDRRLDAKLVEQLREPAPSVNLASRRRKAWHRLWLLCDGADTAMGTGMVAARKLT